MRPYLNTQSGRVRFVLAVSYMAFIYPLSVATAAWSLEAETLHDKESGEDQQRMIAFFCFLCTGRCNLSDVPLFFLNTVVSLDIPDPLHCLESLFQADRAFETVHSVFPHTLTFYPKENQDLSKKFGSEFQPSLILAARVC